jgi:hypothetical protein
MPRHESVTDEYVAELQAGFLAEAERVKAAPDWPETRKRMVTGTYAYLVAIRCADEGWTRERIALDLETRKLFGALPGPTNVIGDEKRDETEDGDGGVRPRK